MTGVYGQCEKCSEEFHSENQIKEHVCIKANKQDNKQEQVLKCEDCGYRDKDGSCHRYPRKVWKEDGDWCGEFQPKIRKDNERESIGTG